MRMSRVILGGVGVAVLAVAGNAFTASNTLEDDTVAGFDNTTVSGAVVTNIRYTPATDVELLDTVVFTSTTELDEAGADATVIFKDAGVLEGSPVACTIGTFTTTVDITCDVSVAFVDFDEVGLTVVSQ